MAKAPAQIVKLCDKHDLPLIQIPADTKYEGLLLDVLGNFLDSNLTLLNRFYDLHRQTMDLALREPTVLEILLKLRGLIHADITFFDSTKDRRTTTSQELSRFTMPRLTEFDETSTAAITTLTPSSLIQSSRAMRPRCSSPAPMTRFTT